MTLQYILYLAIVPVSILVTLWVWIYTIRHRIPRQTTPLIWLIFCVLGWLIFNTLELIAHTPMWTMIWAKISYLFIAATPVAWLVFSAHYTGHQHWLSPIGIWMIAFIPILTIALAVTNDYHHLLWAETTYFPVANMLAIHVEHGPWFWVFAVYGYLMTFAGTTLISQQYFRLFPIYRKQSLWLLVGAFAPVICNVIYVFDLIPGLQKDYTPLSFAIAGIAFAIDIYHYGLFDVRPVARDLIIDSSTDAMIILDKRDHIVDLNPAALALQAKGMDIKLGESIEKFFEEANLIYEPTGDLSFQQDIVLNFQNQRTHFDVRSMPISSRRGDIVGRLFILRDISKRKSAELMLRDQADALETRNRELDAFAHTVAHDLKVPMGTIVGYASMLRQIYLEMPEREFLDSLDGIVTSAVRMSEIVDALLLLSQVRKVEDVPSDVMDMGTIVIRALDRVDNIIKKNGAKIELPSSWPFAMGYGPWVEEVWVNYISNAVKYGGRPQLGVVPVVKLGWEEITPADENDISELTGKALLRFWVHDNGKALPEQEIDQLFVEFTRLAHKSYEGHGLGLSIVKRIVDKLGGMVGVTSSPGDGNIFFFTLPACEF